MVYNRKMIILMKTITYVVIVYSSCVFLLYMFQRSILYVPDREKPDRRASNVIDMQEVTIETKDGLELLAWFKEPVKGKGTIIYFHGNAGNIGTRGPRMRPFLDSGFGVLLISYRGYGGNLGKPSEQGLYKDARAGFEFLLTKNINVRDIIIFGESLGSGVATQMALEYPTKFLILQSPYTSMVNLGQEKYPIFPVRLFLKDRYDSIDKIRDITQNVLIFHGAQDLVVPFVMGQELYNAASDPKELFIVKEKDHVDIMDRSMASKIMQYLDQNTAK